jgi:hypothetical protein
MNELTLVQGKGDRRLNALLKLLLCELGYGAVLIAVYWGVTHGQLSLRNGIEFLLIFTFTLLLLAWVTTFKPYRK